MKVGKCLSCLLIPCITSMCLADDMRWTDFLKRHGQQLEQMEEGSTRTIKIAHMLSRQLQSMAKGGDINARDKRGQTALMMAAALNNEEIVHGLLLRGADPAIATLNGRCAHHLSTNMELTRCLVSCCLKAAPGTSLHDAVQRPENTVEHVLKALRAGADVNQLNAEGKTALMLVPAGNAEVARLLLEAGANPAHWAMDERAKARVNRVEILFTHRSLSSEELEKQDKQHALILDKQRADQVKWQRFVDVALVRLKPRNRPVSFQWDRKENHHISNNLIYKRNAEPGKGGPGRSGYIGPVYRGKVTLHYDQDGVPPMSFPVQSGGRANGYSGTEECTAPTVPEGMQARIYPDFHGYSINGFYITCMGRKAIPQFSEDRSNILLHLALIAVPGETEETTIRSTGSHGCISLKNLSDWKTVYHELREKGHTPRDGIEVSINYAVK